MVYLSAWWAWVQQPCINVAEESFCPQSSPSPNRWYGRGTVGWRFSHCWAPWLQGSAMLQLLVCTLLLFCRELGKGQCLLEGRDHHHAGPEQGRSVL